MVRLCSVKGCNKKHDAQSYCPTHYQMWRRHGDPLHVPVHVTRFCSIDGCENKHWAKKFCKHHYKKWKRYGDPSHIPVHVTRICSIEGCENKHRANDFCSFHNENLRRRGDPLHVPVHVTRICSIEGCENKHMGNDFCSSHYEKWRRWGDPKHITDPKETGRKISKSNKGKIAWNKGKTGIYSEETLKKIGDASKGRKLSKEHKKKISVGVNKAFSDPRMRKKLSDAQHRPDVLKKNRERIRTPEERRNNAIAHSTPKMKEMHRERLRKTRRDQQKPNKKELTIKKILMDGGLIFNPEQDLKRFTKSSTKSNFGMFINIPFSHKQLQQKFKEVDFLIPPDKIIEHNGTYDHADPRKYSSNTKIRKLTAQDIWEKEKMILNSLKKENYRILVIWQFDLEKNTENVAKKILKFALS